MPKSRYLGGKKKRRGLKMGTDGRAKLPDQYFTWGFPMVRSAAFRSLSGSAVKVFCELRTRYNGYNNGEIFLGVDQGARLLHMSKSSVSRGLSELEAKGFVKKTRQGNFYFGRATTWIITHLSPGPEENPTHDWKRWIAPDHEKQKPTS